MIKRSVWGFLFCGYLALFAQNALAVAKVGESVPDFALTTLAGDAVKLSDYVGKKPVYIVFWATWCAACTNEIPHVKKIQEKFGDKLAILAINIGIDDSVEKAKAYQKKHEVTYSMAFDHGNKISKSFNIKITPTQLIVGKDGKVYYRGHKAPSVADVEGNWKDLTQP